MYVTNVEQMRDRAKGKRLAHGANKADCFHEGPVKSREVAFLEPLILAFQIEQIKMQDVPLSLNQLNKPFFNITVPPILSFVWNSEVAPYFVL